MRRAGQHTQTEQAPQHGNVPGIERNHGADCDGDQHGANPVRAAAEDPLHRRRPRGGLLAYRVAQVGGRAGGRRGAQGGDQYRERDRHVVWMQVAEDEAEVRELGDPVR